MKKKSVELDVDFIGGQDKLTKEEELALSNYFAQKRNERNRILSRKPTDKKKKVKA